MPKPKNSVITIQTNQMLEIPNDTIPIEIEESQEVSPIVVDTTGNQELHLDSVEIIEPQEAKPDLTETGIKVKKQRMEKEKVAPATVIEESEAVKPDEVVIQRPIEVSDVLNVEPELTEKEVKLLQLVKCEKCNRKKK